MTEAGTVEGHDRLRLFCGLRLPSEALDIVSCWQSVEFADAAVRVVPPANLHVTLAFLGARPAGEVPAIRDELRAAAQGAGPVEFRLADRPYRETRSVGMLVLRDLDGEAGALAGEVQTRLERLGSFRREPREWLPHLTVIRFDRPPRHRFECRAPLPLGRFSPSDAALYTSALRRTGAQYQVLESVALGG